MNRSLLAGLLLTSVLVTAGCAAPAAELSNPNLTIEVRSASGVEGGCIVETAGRYCHTLVVHLRNDNENENADNNLFYWEARTANGSIVMADSRDGPDAVAPGKEAQTTLKFETDEAVPLVNLTYSAVWMRQPIEVAIPAYAIQPWDSGIRITVQGSDVRPGSCGLGDDGSCHELRVHVRNEHPKEKVEKSAFYWEGRTAQGEVFRAYYDTEGPDAIAPGSEGTFVIRFELEEASRLVQIQYEAAWMLRPATAAVPAY